MLSRTLVIALSLTCTLPVMAQTLKLPDMGDYSRQYLSGNSERRLGEEVIQRIRDRGLIIEDVQLNEYLASVGQRIATYADTSEHGYRFFWIDAPSINAFAAPGALVAINAGLLLATRNEDELAGVLAHEIAHVSQRHIARAIADAQRLAIPMAAALLASAILAAATDSDLGQAAIAGTAAIGTQRRIDYTRANEQEADRIGTQLLAKAGYDPAGMADFFGRLQQAVTGAAVEAPEYLLTHPRPGSRAADTQDRVAPLPRNQSQPRDTLAYYLAKARLKVLTNPNTQTLLQRFKATLQNDDYEQAAAERYGYALALKRAGRYADAAAEIAQLRRNDPDRLAYRIEEAELALAQREAGRAWNLFEEARALYGDDYTLAMHYAQALVNDGDARRAMNVLQPQLRRRSLDAPLYALYAQAAQRAGDPAAAHAALTEYYYLNNQLKAAIEQAELGLRQTAATEYQQAQLRARLRQLRQEAETTN